MKQADIANDLHTKPISRTSRDMSDLSDNVLNLLHNIGTIGLIVSAFTVALFTWLTTVMATEQGRRRAAEIASAATGAAEANKAADEARFRAAELEAEAASLKMANIQLERRLEAEKRQRLELESLTKPRFITEEQAARALVIAGDRLKGMKISVGSSFDAEETRLARQIADLLRCAGAEAGIRSGIYAERAVKIIVRGDGRVLPVLQTLSAADLEVMHVPIDDSEEISILVGAPY